MELNELPDKYNEAELGPQKRQTEFDSPEAKLAYDAQNLVRIAKEQSERMGVTVDPITLARRKDNDVDALRAAIAKEQKAVNPVGDAATTPAEAQKRELEPERVEEVIQLLKSGHEAKENKDLCPTLDWSRAEKALRATPEALCTVDVAKKNGHEPAIYFSDETGFDIGTLAKESPQSTRNCVYDKTAEQWLAANRPGEIYNGNAEDQAAAMGWQLMGVEQGNHIASNTPAYSEQGWRWYKTADADTRTTGGALAGYRGRDALRVNRSSALNLSVYGGWGGSLRVNYVA